MKPLQFVMLLNCRLDRQSGDARSGSGMTRGKVRCPIGVGHDGGEGSAWYHIVIAGLTGNLEGQDGEERGC